MTTTAHEEHEHEHPSFLAHHFDTPQQQFDSGKLGIWLFLTTEILLFSGLFCAYAVYRANHPEIFEYAHLYLNKTLGAVNTIVLIFSSFTMAWAVRASQLGESPFIIKSKAGKEIFRTSHRKLCVALLGITIACGGAFMVVKYFEYAHKFHEQTLPGPYYKPVEFPGAVEAAHKEHEEEEARAAAMGIEHPVLKEGDAAPTVTTAPDGFALEQSAVPRAMAGPAGVDPAWISAHSPNRELAAAEHVAFEPKNAQTFFSIYFLMTGLHGIHVLAGMALIGWVLIRANRGEFHANYFAPVDFVGLYWHVVDLIWIFLFPLLYLIA